LASRTWKGSISFGLVNIPVGVYLATKDADFPLTNYAAMAIGFVIRNDVLLKSER
jgi:non-homologous end joining protein Ku